MAIGDMNGDGLNDVVFGNDGGDNELFLNDGEGNIPNTPVILPGESLVTYGVAIGDFNNDGHNDIFFANYNGAQQLLLNDGNGNFTSVKAIPILGRTSTYAWDAHAVDINKDGNLDVVIPVYTTTYGSNVLLGDGDGGFTAIAIELDDAVYSARYVSSADFDGDGDIDLVITNWGTNPGTNLFLNDGGSIPTFTRQNIPHSYGSGSGIGIVATDVNNDKRADFIVTRHNYGSNLLFTNNGDGGAASFTQSVLPGRTNQQAGLSVDTADVDDDGFVDIAIGNWGKPNQLLLNNGMGGFDADGVSELPQANGEQNTYATKFGDIDGDSVPDLVFNNAGQQKVVLINTLPPPSTTTTLPPPPTTTEDVWQIVFTGLDANFTATSRTELSLKFDIGRNPTSNGSTAGRYNTMLYEKDCATEIATSGTGPLLFSLTDNGRISKSPANPTFDAIDLLYDVNKTMIAASSVWNSTTNEIEICQEVQLIEQSSTLEMVIVEDKRVITINFDLSASFDLGVDLEEAALTSANTTTDVQDYVTAYKCDDSFAEDNSLLVANDELFVCIESSSDDVEIGDIQTMVRF